MQAADAANNRVPTQFRTTTSMSADLSIVTMPGRHGGPRATSDSQRVTSNAGLRGQCPMHRIDRSTRRPGDPLRIESLGVGFGFLLIVRTERIFTVHEAGTVCLRRERVPSDTRIFQHIARFCNRHSDVCLTVIVTAAVYWGLSSKLRSEELTYPLDLPAPGRRQSVYSVLRLRTLLCF